MTVPLPAPFNYSQNALEAFLQAEIAPQAHGMDQDPAALRAALAALGDRNLLALRAPKPLGGGGVDGNDYWQFQAAIARVSGALAFLQTQHQSAVNFIAGGGNEALQRQLPAMASGEMLLGVGFSHLRRGGEPCLTATALDSGDSGEQAGGYRLTGTIPWATGWQFFSDLVVGASLDDGRSLLALIPFRSLEQAGGVIECSEPMALAALGVTATVSLRLENWVVEPGQVITINPENWLAEADRRNVLKSTSLVLGCAEAALDLIEERMQLPDNQALQIHHERLARSLRSMRRLILVELADPGLGFGEQVALRGRSIALCGRCVQGAIAMAGGAANAMTHPAQRIYRESLVFTVTGQTPAVRAATLDSLSQNLP